VKFLDKDEILKWLREEDPSRLRELYERADAIRREHLGDAVHLRGLIEISNHCIRQCMYCGLRNGNRKLQRYRMAQEEIFDSARLAERLGHGTVVIQAGEDYALTAEWIAVVVRWIKKATRLAVTLSLGERPADELKLWRTAGADRYLLRFETSDEQLFRVIHPPFQSQRASRTELLRELKTLGYEAGGGIMIGIPGQSFDSVANDIIAFQELDLDMIGIGPYIPHPATPLGSGKLRPAIAPAEQVPNSEEMVLKAVALARIACPTVNIPSTTALATIDKKDGRKLGLMVGANVVMPNLTPEQYRRLYEIYPAKACVGENAIACNQCLRGQLHSIGRFVGTGPGGRGSISVPGPVPVPSLQLVPLAQ
jgi:biotin synthase